MSKNWSKVLLVSMLVVMVAASMSFATTARVRSLANTGDYMSDDSNVNRWYSTLPSYANQVNAELGNYNQTPRLTDSRGLGWTHHCEYGTYRISLNENALDHPGFWIINPFFQDYTPGNVSPANVLGDASFNAMPINTYDLAGGWEIGENHAVGVSFTRSSASWESTGRPDSSRSRTFTTFGAGYSWSNNEDMMADFLFNFGMAGGKDELGIGTTAFPMTKIEWDSKNAIDFAGRFFYDWKDNVTVPVNAEFITAEYALTRSVTPAPATSPEYVPPRGEKVTSFMLGAGLNMDVNEDHMLIFAVEFANMKWEYSKPDTAAVKPTDLAEVSTTILPTFRLALESSINSWLTTRVGAARYMGKQTHKSADGKEIKQTEGAGSLAFNPGWMSDYVDLDRFDWFLGLGFNVAEWTIDMELEHRAPFSVGYWLTGYTAYPWAGDGPVARISAVYNY